ncbi:MAG: histidine kinase [Bacteroidales bacterium]|nr:histidine kinase [Bacteroidales bacterium]
MPFLQNIKSSWVIHVFAILHAAVALICRLSGVDDELLLTMLTMTMSLIICYKKGISIEFTAAIIIISNIIGYLMGTLGATIINLIFTSQYTVNALSTAITTEVLGWSILAITKLFRAGYSTERRSRLSSSYIKWILIAAIGIFIIRSGIVIFFSRDSIETGAILKITGRVLSNSLGIIILICLNILYVRFAANIKGPYSKLKTTLVLCVFFIATTCLETIITGYDLPFNQDEISRESWPQLAAICLITQVTVYCVVYMINYALSTRSEMFRQKEKAHMAQYRYLKLKRQVNPHFLFNSLNILDCLVCEEKTEQASTYIHKLAGIYRYMIKNEDEALVPLEDELNFVNKYVDLLKVRFPEGFDVVIDVTDVSLKRLVLPCSIQLLIENATKHNAVTVEKPLVIKVESGDEEYISVSNNIIPKVSMSESTGLGQKYIRRQYKDLSGKEIVIVRSEDTYKVTLPLL